MNIAFLGAGNIAQAIIGGLLQGGTPADRIVAADPFDEIRARVSDMGIRALATNGEAAASADTVMICVKPGVVAEALASLAPPHDGKLFISVAAGVTTATIIDALGGYANVVRCMPNTPALVQEGMTALFAARGVDDASRATAEGIMNAVGATLWVGDEADLDAVTAVSGSGPAYFFYLMEAMTKAAEKEGLPAAAARQLVTQTALGSARIVQRQGSDPAALRRNVTSPGGTTQAAIASLERAGFEDDIIAAIHAARQRSVELSAG